MEDKSTKPQTSAPPVDAILLKKRGGRPMGAKNRPGLHRNTSIVAFPRDRMDRVAALLRVCTPHDQLQTILSHEWGMTRRHIRAYITAVYAEWKESEPEHIAEQRSLALQAWTQFFRDAKEAGEWPTAAVALDRLTKVQGAYAPEKQIVEHSGLGALLQTVDPDKIRARLEELREKQPK